MAKSTYSWKNARGRKHCPIKVLVEKTAKN